MPTIQQMEMLLNDIPDDVTCLVEEPWEAQSQIPAGKTWIIWFLELARNLENNNAKLNL